MEIEQQMLASLPCGTLRTGRETWRLYVLDVRRVHRDWFVHLVVIGARTHTLDVRARGDAVHSVTAQRVLGAVRDWLVSGDLADQAFLELPDVLEPAC